MTFLFKNVLLCCTMTLFLHPTCLKCSGHIYTGAEINQTACWAFSPSYGLNLISAEEGGHPELTGKEQAGAGQT